MLRFRVRASICGLLLISMWASTAAPALAVVVKPPRFLAARGYQVPVIPTSVAIADMDRDGRPDIVAGTQDGFISLLRNQGRRTFDSAKNFTTTTNAEFLDEMEVIDLNADGFPDVVGVSDHPGTGLGTAWVLINDGGVGFQTAVTYPQSRRLGGLGAGDLDGDGDADLAMPTSNQLHTKHGIAIMTNAGDGTFGSPVEDPASTGGSSASMADVNGDDANDVVMLDVESNQLGVFLGDGQGGLGIEAEYPAGESTSTLVIGDVNLDGFPDAVVGSYTGEGWLLLNEGGGTFGPATAVDLGTAGGTPDLAIADLQGDGIPDIAASNSNGWLTPIFGAGDGTFQTGGRFGAGQGPEGVAAGDLDGDGKPDVAVVGNPGSVATLYGSGRGRYLATPVLSLSSDVDTVPALAATDVSGDGLPDLVMSAGNGQIIGSRRSREISPGVAISLNLGGRFPQPTFYPVPWDPSGFATGDFNEDGILDLAASLGANDLTNLAVLLGTGGGSFASPVLTSIENFPAGISVGDFDNDGHLDIALGISNSARQFVEVGLLPGVGDGSFGSVVTSVLGSGDTQGILADHFDGDANLDVALQIGDNLSSKAFVVTALGTGTGMFTTLATYSAGRGLGELHATDLDGNGAVDIVASAPDTNQVIPLLGVGDGSFVPGTPLHIRAAEWMALADFNTDSNTDIVVIGRAGIMWSLGGIGDGTFGPAIGYASPMGPIVAGDFDGNGAADAAVCVDYELLIHLYFGGNP